MSEPVLPDSVLRDLLAARRLGVLATIRRDGRPQLSTVTYAYDRAAELIRVSITADRAKTRNLRRDPRGVLQASSDDGWSYVVADGAATLSAVAAAPDDAAVDELVALYRSLSGEHPDWDEYRAAMVHDQRLVLRLSVDRVYGTAH
ncbi:MAG TPA: PPOX class F420-dependent oxidoreductase [Actinopolymorphaceae bacterium]|jgi:PPOX class probable F420-dependent enzyme